MRITILLFVALSISFNALSQQYKGSSWSEVKAAGAGSYSVVFFPQPGVIMKGDDGKPKGFGVELMADFAAFVKNKYKVDLSIKYVAEEPAFDKFLLAAQNNANILAVSNIIITDERRKLMKFTPYLLPNPVVLLTNKGTTDINDLSEIASKFNGYTAYVIAGSIHQKMAEDIKKKYSANIKIEPLANGAEVIKMISTNSSAFSVMDFPEFVDAIRRRLPVKRQKAELNMEMLIGFAMSKQSDWDVVWNEFITDEYRKSPKYKKMVVDNLGSTYLSIMK